jgi:hypothetical protein
MTPYAAANLGWKFFLMFAIFNVSIVFYTYFILRETTGRALEDMDSVFGIDMKARIEAARRKARWEQDRSERLLRSPHKTIIDVSEEFSQPGPLPYDAEPVTLKLHGRTHRRPQFRGPFKVDGSHLPDPEHLLVKNLPPTRGHDILPDEYPPSHLQTNKN